MSLRGAFTPGGRKRLRATTIVMALLVAVAGVGIGSWVTLVQAAEGPGLFSTSIPATESHADRAAVELGVRFSSSKNGTVSGIRFYKGSGNVGPHIGRLWDETGHELAEVTFLEETATGWQQALFEEPVTVAAGATYVASYTAPKGRYAVTVEDLAHSRTAGSLTVPAGGGVYAYGGGDFPTQMYRNNNYYVDVLYDDLPRDHTPPPGTLDLPRIPWEGGPTYWEQFNKADAAGWDDPDFFPIVVWFNSISTNEEVQYDKSLGINTYIGLWEGTDFRLLTDNGMYWIGSKLNDTFEDDSPNWVGYFLDDEVDGRFPPEEGRARLQSILNSLPDDGRFHYANFTQMVVSGYFPQTDALRYVNDYTDVTSLDMYWYTIPYCDRRPYTDSYLVPVEEDNCRTASSYGKMVRSLRMRDAADARLQPMWQFVENLSGTPSELDESVFIQPGQLEGAVMSSIINEARGIIYFNQVLNGECTSGSVFRQTQIVEDYCGTDQVTAAKRVNERVRELAKVINTQSYVYSFGTGLDTMLKTSDGYAYVFAMVDGSSQPGTRAFQLPPGVDATTAEVLFEDRTVQIDSAGRFKDEFEHEHTYHVYRVPLTQ